MNEETNLIMKTKRKKTKRVTKIHRVYCTYLPDKRYYIGYSSKPDKQFEKYYGSNTIVKEANDWGLWLDKEVILQTKNKNEAKIQEFLLQWQCRHDTMCLNDMIHIRLRLKYLKDFTPVVWAPRHTSDTFIETIEGKYQIRQ